MIPNNISDQLAGALCNTLMHSLWQGIILAAIAGLIVIGTRQASSALRYNLLVCALTLFAAAVSVTFVTQCLKGGAAAQPIFYKVGDVNEKPVADPTAQPAQTTDFVAGVSAYLQAHRNTIVMVWFLIICARSLQLGVGLYGTYRLKRVKVRAMQGHWAERTRQLAHALGVTRSIALLESGLARTPLVIGHLKPVILVPLGLLTTLAPQQVEAILIHELAHIKRRDYLVNMLQSLLEIIFFFNPAVLWISRLIKVERENCCDDLAVDQDHNKANYIRALVSCEEYKAFVPPYAMAFPGGRNTLLHRVKRMASNRNHSLNLFEKTMLALCLVGAGLFMTAFSSFHHKPQHIQPQHIQRPSHIDPAPAPSVPKQPATALHTTAIAPHTPVRHQQQPVRVDTTIKHQPSSSTIPPLAAQPIQDSADTTEVNPYTNTGYDNRPYRSAYSQYADQHERYMSDAAIIKIELIKEGLVSDTNHLRFTINEKEFILNGVKQPREVFLRYKSQFDANDSPGWSWGHGTWR